MIPSRHGRNRFTALDGWRGIAACMVVLFHVRAPSHVSELALVRNSFLFVDFFFVLSGFVIAATYAERLAGGLGIGRFMLLRFGRLFPLHLAVLAAFVGLELMRNGALSPADPLGALVPRLLLIHGLGPFDTEIWNVPSWSISSEFFAYLLFALAVAAAGARHERLLVGAALVGAAILYAGAGKINAAGYEMVRCVYGFAIGAGAWHLFVRSREALPRGNLAEGLAIAAVVAFVSIAGENPWSIAAPLVFCAVVLVFASERGMSSRLLNSRPFLFLGAVSYSVYMVHLFVAHRVVEGLTFAQRLGLSLVADKWAGDVLIALCLMLVVAVAALTYRFIEVPAREWFRRRAQAVREPGLLHTASD